MDSYVVNLDEIDQTQVALAGGKGALLGELSRIDGVFVPPGVCVTTAAFAQTLAGASSIDDRLERLARLSPKEGEAVRTLSSEIRHCVEGLAVPADLAAAITDAVARLGEQAGYAVRSSATVEDGPSASSAGQHDTYLNVVGAGAVLRHVSRCWASLFSERAVTYRLRDGLDHREVQMAVIVQQMVDPLVSGVLFTADPVTSNRKVVSIEASFGLGEGLVSGRVTPDVYEVRGGEILARTVAVKRFAVHASPSGGTEERAVEPGRQRQPALADRQVVRLEALGRRIEAHFGRPQDIEWTFTGDRVQIVQSRPITTLFPIPETTEPGNRVYVSVGHQQMMTEAMKPLGLSFWHLTTRRRMHEAAGRLFVDITRALASPAARAGHLKALERSDPLIGDALQTILERDGFIQTLPDDDPDLTPADRAGAPIEADPDLVAELIGRSQASIAALKREIQGKTGAELLDFIQVDIQELQRILFDPQNLRVIMAGMQAAWWLNDRLEAWLGEKNAADALTQSVPHNVTSEMGLALMDVADAIRPHPEVVAYLHDVEDDGFLGALPGLPGGAEAQHAIRTFLDRYGMRCVGEIDITRPRWSERPTTLLPIILGHIKNFEPGAGKRRLEQGRQAARAKELELLARLRRLPDGEEKALETERVIARLRTFAGYREYPKFGMVSRYFIYKQALVEEAERLTQAHVLKQKEDIFYLRFEELRTVVCTGQRDDELIRRRREEFRAYQSLTPPRVLTSDGEMLAGRYRRDDAPDNALLGLAVSAGTVEGRARVITDFTQADLKAGDILVTTYTDPSWTPLFVTIGGLVTEVGGLMTHGAVIAREYGLPAVVGVQRATQLIRDGQQIRVNGTEGYVEIVP